jgi:hypothetical protein
MKAYLMIDARGTATPDDTEPRSRRVIPLAFVVAPHRAMSISPGS